jgi:hypothetical protein
MTVILIYQIKQDTFYVTIQKIEYYISKYTLENLEVVLGSDLTRR